VNGFVKHLVAELIEEERSAGLMPIED
jgi:hypothetical protein